MTVLPLRYCFLRVARTMLCPMHQARCKNRPGMIPMEVVSLTNCWIHRDGICLSIKKLTQSKDLSDDHLILSKKLSIQRWSCDSLFLSIFSLFSFLSIRHNNGVGPQGDHPRMCHVRVLGATIHFLPRRSSHHGMESKHQKHQLWVYWENHHF